MRDFKFDLDEIARERWRWYDKEHEIAVSSRGRYKIGAKGEPKSDFKGWEDLLNKVGLRYVSLYEASAILFVPFTNIEATRVNVMKCGSWNNDFAPLERHISWYKDYKSAKHDKNMNRIFPKSEKTILDKAVKEIEKRKFEAAVEKHLAKNFKFLEVEDDEHD